MTDRSRLSAALLASWLLHAALIGWLPWWRATRHAAQAPLLVDVDVLPFAGAAVPHAPLPPAAPPRDAPPQAVVAKAEPVPPPPLVRVPERQIVSPPDAGEEKEPAHARLLSDRNNTVREERIRRGPPAAGNPEAQPASRREPNRLAKAGTNGPPSSRGAEQVGERESAVTRAGGASSRRSEAPPQLPGLDRLFASAGDLIRDGIVAGTQIDPGTDSRAAARPRVARGTNEGDGRAAGTGEGQTASVRRDLLRHGDPWRTGSLRGGSLDFLPGIRDGDVTMLNTKADQFAPFVRRVAVRVFETFWIQLRRSVDRGLVDSMEESATVEAIMDAQGQLLQVRPKQRSGGAILGTERNLQGACREAFFDRNPPRGAEADDGRIHFVFDVRVALTAQPGRGVLGYRALFGAALL